LHQINAIQIMYCKLLVILLLLAAHSAQTTRVTPCGGNATLDKVKIEGCQDGVDGRCQFLRGKSYKFEVEAIASKLM
jgi:hypothetical protein